MAFGGFMLAAAATWWNPLNGLTAVIAGFAATALVAGLLWKMAERALRAGIQ